MIKVLYQIEVKNFDLVRYLFEGLEQYSLP